MSRHLPFAASEQSTLGVEWELALVDAGTGVLRSDADTVLGEVARNAGLAPGTDHPRITQELLQNTVELVTGVCHRVEEAVAQLRTAAREVQAVTDPLGLELYSQGSHPFALPTDEPVTEKDRYGKMIARTQWWGGRW